MFSLFLGAIFGVGIYFASSEVAEAEEFIRVLILRDVSRLEVSGQGLVLQDLETGQRFFKNTRFSSLIIKREARNRLRVEGYPISAGAFLLSSSNGPMVLNGRRYRDNFKIFPGQKRDLWVINDLPLKEYLVGLINYEISSEWFLEVAKAQAVVARTYATFQKRIRSGELYDVESGVNDQVYGGIDREDERSRWAVNETDGELLLYQGNPIFAVYHACCGGKTESPEYLWAGNFPYLKGTHCGFCLDSPHFYWNYQVERETLGKTLRSVGFSGSVVGGIEVVERSPSGRVLQLLIKDGKSLFQITGKELRRLLGYDLLRSTNFVVQESGEGYLFSGLGWGHGIGMCQWGAKGMAEKGADYRAIIHYYYRKVEIRKFVR